MTAATRRLTSNAVRTHNTSTEPQTGHWSDSGLCREDPELFFPVGDTMYARQRAVKAKAVCERCPVMEQCRRWAFEDRQDDGVLGGMTAKERRRIHGRRDRTMEAPRRNIAAADYILQQRLDDYMALQEQGLPHSQIASRLGTNVPTVYQVARILEERAGTSRMEVAAA